MVDDASVRLTVTVEGAGGDDLDEAVRETIAESVREEFEPLFERVRLNNQGKSVAHIKEALRHELADTALTLSDADLTEKAEVLASGESVTITVVLPDGF